MEDQGEGICFNVYVYNDQPGITIDYATGASSLEGDALPEDSTQKEPEDTVYRLYYDFKSPISACRATRCWPSTGASGRIF